MNDKSTELWGIDSLDVHDDIRLFVEKSMIIKEMDHKLEFSIEIPIYKN